MILVTGGTGLVGSHLLYRLARSGRAVRALKRPSSGDALVRFVFRHEPDLFRRIAWAEGDITDVLSLEDALEGVSEVYHCAALVSFQPSDARRLLQVNAGGTANVVNAALSLGVRKFCHVSSTAALGRTAEDAAMDETASWENSKHNTGYAVSKYCAEREVWRAMEEGLPAVIVNPSIVLGPGDWRTGSTALFGAVWNGLRYYPTGATGFVDVRDVAECMTGLMDKNCLGRRYILSAENLPYRDVIGRIARAWGRPEPTVRVGPLLSEIGWRVEAFRSLFRSGRPMITRETARNGRRRWLYSNERIRNELSFSFRPIGESIDDACRAFLEMRPA